MSFKVLSCTAVQGGSWEWERCQSSEFVKCSPKKGEHSLRMVKAKSRKDASLLASISVSTRHAEVVDLGSEYCKIGPAGDDWPKWYAENESDGDRAAFVKK